MKKLISFTMFLTLVLVIALAKSSQAQVTTTKVNSAVVAPIGFIKHTDPMRIPTIK